MGVRNIFHVRFLNPYLPGATQEVPLDTIGAGDNREYEIKRILSYNKIRWKTIYQVRWRGYGTMEDSWLR